MPATSRLSPAARCRSSVVEHSLGKGEVVCSIHTGSTIRKTEKMKFALGVAVEPKKNRQSKATSPNTHEVYPDYGLLKDGSGARLSAASPVLHVCGEA
jgi:hypothetical protein